ncbi:Nonsense-mediated mRNA decay protein 5, partial [Massospora cicadina]
MVGQDSNEAAAMSSLPKSQQEPATLISWGNLFIQVIEKAVPNHVLPEDASERENVPWVKTRKWGYHCLNRLFERYGNPAMLEKNSKYYRFAQKFANHFAPNILKVYLEQVDRAISGAAWLSRKCAFFTSTFFTECVHHKGLWQKFLPYAEKVITQFIYPQLCYTGEDEEEMEDNPSEFLHRRLMTAIDKVIDSEASSELLSCMVRVRKRQTLDGILSFANGVLDKHRGVSGPVADRSKDGALALIEAVADVITEADDDTQTKVAVFFGSFVFGELGSPSPLLRFRACSMIRAYSELDLPEALVQEAFQGVVGCLGHPQLIVRVGAALALQGLIPYKCIDQAMVSLLPQITEQILLLTTQIDQENLAEVLESLVEYFPTELAPYSLRLCESLVGTLGRLINEISRPDDENESEDGYPEEENDKVYTAMGVLKTLGTIVISLDNSPATVLQLEHLILPAVRRIFDLRIDAIYDETFETIDCFIYSLRAVSAPVWELFDLLYPIAYEDASPYLAELCTLFDNFVSFGAARFVQDPALQGKLFSLFSKVMASADSSDDRVCVCKLMLSMLLHLQQAGTPMIAPIFQIAFPFIADHQNLHNRAQLASVLKVIIACLLVDVPTAITLMEENACTANFFTLWFTKLDLFPGVHDKKLSIAAICRILTFPVASFPPPSSLAGALPEAIEKYNKAIKRCGEEDSDGPESQHVTSASEGEEESDYEEAEEGSEREEEESIGSDDLSDSELSDDDVLDSDLAKSPLSSMDAYLVFQEVFHHLELNDTASFGALVADLTEEQHQAVQKLLQTAAEHRANPPPQGIQSLPKGVVWREAPTNTLNLHISCHLLMLAPRTLCAGFPFYRASIVTLCQ